MSHPSSGRDPVEELAEEFAARYRQGEHPSVTDYTDKYPELAERIRALFPALVVMEQVRSLAGGPFGPFDPKAGEGSAPPQQLGDYRILREVGRGGMGVVYEAVQESLGRHVALKILPFHRLMDPTHLERFKREARAAAQLHHTNIVPVFGVGEAEGIHYYAMQFIQGQGLDAVLEDVRRLRGRKSGAAAEGREPACDLCLSVAQSLLTGRFLEIRADEEAAAEHLALAEPAMPRPPIGSGQSSSHLGAAARTADAQSDLAGQTEWQYCRSVAQVGVQVAEALAYAHKQRILHRDIKPSNLLLDTQGTVWITDFGLAKTEGSDDLTRPGDIVGTVRFMAPERFQGKADLASDVYSLGITMYEMLTLRPAFADANRARVVERVTQEDPPRLRELDPRLPRDLETIVLKAIAKEPAHRYPTADALAEDLRRFLNNEPIQARPVSRLERLWRWSKRNPVIAGLSAAVLLLLLLVAGIASVGYVRTTLALSQEATQRALAEDAEARAKDEAVRARKAEADLRILYYTASMGLVQAAWESHNMLRFQALLSETADFPERGFEWYYWQRLCRVEHLTLLGHKGGLTALAFAPDGRRLVTAGNDGTARVWDATSGQELFCLRRHRSQVTAVAFAPDSHWLVTGSTDGTARVWDANSGRELRILRRPDSGPVWSVAVTLDGKRVVTGSEDRTGRVWDSASGQELVPLKNHTGRVWAGAASPDGRLVTGGDRTARVWDADGGRELLTLKGHTGEVRSVAISANGQWLVTGSDDLFKLRDAANGRELRILDHGSGMTRSVTLTPDGKRVIMGRDDGLTKVWDTASGRELLTLMAQKPSCVTWLPLARMDSGWQREAWTPRRGFGIRQAAGEPGPSRGTTARSPLARAGS